MTEKELEEAMEKTFTVECKCGSDNFVVVDGNVSGFVKRIGEYIMPIKNDKEITTLMTICCKCKTVIHDITFKKK